MKEKKLIIALLAVILLTLTVISCSDSKKEGNGLPTEEDIDMIYDKDFRIGVGSGYVDDTLAWAIFFNTHYSGDDITVALKIDDVQVNWDYEHYDMCYTCLEYHIELISTSFALTHGNIYNFNLTVNGVTNSGNLTIPHILKITQPTIMFDQSKNYTFNWTLARNPMIQAVYWYWYWDDASVPVKASSRSYTLPAGAVPENWKFLEFDVTGMNYREAGNVLFYALTSDQIMIENEDIMNMPMAEISWIKRFQERKARIENLLQIINP